MSRKIKLEAILNAPDPTQEELKDSAIAWYKNLAGTSLDELPKEVMAMSAKTDFFEFDKSLCVDFFEPTPPAKGIDDLVAEMDSKLGWDGKIYKLNTRSPKDAWCDDNPITVSPKHGLHYFSYSERILDDMSRLRHHPTKKIFICAREPFFGMERLKTWEFRCFVKDGNLIAVTDYDYANPNKKLIKCEKKVRKKIDEFFINLHSEMHLQTYVFDVCFTAPDKIILIEVNPYGLSDPCFLRTYDAVESFDGWIAHEGNAND